MIATGVLAIAAMFMFVGSMSIAETCADFRDHGWDYEVNRQFAGTLFLQLASLLFVFGTAIHYAR